MVTIADTNDSLRKQLSQDFLRGEDRIRIILTSGVLVTHLSIDSILLAVASFDSIDETSGGDSEHTFGKINVDDVEMYWKIEYSKYRISPPSDNADIAKSVRVLTIMLSSERSKLTERLPFRSNIVAV